MNNSGDAAEQVVRLSLEGTEMVLRLSGSAAKNVAAALYVAVKNADTNKTKGQQRLNSMLKSGKELKVFTIAEKDLKKFAEESKKYGVVYCALRGKEKSADGNVDIMVRAEDAAKINRIVERFKLSAVDTASIKHEIEKTRAEQQRTAAEDRHLWDDIVEPVPKPKEVEKKNPPAARTGSPQSEPISERHSSDESRSTKPSVRKQLDEIRAARRMAEQPSRKRDRQPEIRHVNPGKKKKSKTKGR